MILAIYINKHRTYYYLLRNDEEVQKLRKDLAQEYFKFYGPYNSFDVDQYWQDKADCGLEYFFTTSLTYHYEQG